ncbi:hypothetical protein QTN25_003652 [Entamoeba marina]
MEINISEQESLVIFIQNALDLNQVIFKGNKSLSYKEFLLQQQKIYPNIENDLVTSFYYGMYIKDLHSTSSVFNPQQVTYDDYPNFLWTYPESSFIEFLLPFIKPLISSLIHKITDNHKTLIIVVRLLSQTSLLNYIIQLISSLITPPISQNSFNMLLCALITDITRKNFNQITVWGDVMKVICFIIDDGFIEPLVNTHLRRALRENKLESRNFQRDYLINAGVYDIMNSFCICDVNILTNIIQSILSLENSNLTINIIPKLINHILLSNVTRWESINQSILCLFEEILKTSSTLGCELSQVMFEFYLYLTKYPQQFNSCDKWFFSYLLHLPTTTLDYCRHVNVSILSILTKDHQISYESLKQIIIFLSINYSLHYSVVLRTILNYLSGEPKQNQTTPIQSSVKYNVMIKGQDKPQTYNEISTKKGLKLLMFLHDNTKNELKEDDEMMVLQTILKLMKITSIKELSKQFFPLLEEYFEFIINKQHNSEMLNQMFQTLFQISNGDIGKNNDGFYMNLLDLLKLKFFVTSNSFELFSLVVKYITFILHNNSLYLVSFSNFQEIFSLGIVMIVQVHDICKSQNVFDQIVLSLNEIIKIYNDLYTDENIIKVLNEVKKLIPFNLKHTNDSYSPNNESSPPSVNTNTTTSSKQSSNLMYESLDMSNDVFK